MKKIFKRIIGVSVAWTALSLIVPAAAYFGGEIRGGFLSCLLISYLAWLLIACIAVGLKYLIIFLEWAFD